MSRSAVLFLPPYITMFTNSATSRPPCFGSGRISRRAHPALRLLGLRGLRLLCVVLRTALPASRHPRGVQGPPDDVVPDAREVLHAAPADEHDRVLVQVVADPGDVGRHLEAVGQADARDLPERRVRLFRGRGVHADAHPTLLGTGLHGGRLGLLAHRLAALPDQLVNRRHSYSSAFSWPQLGQNPNFISDRGTFVNCPFPDGSYPASATASSFPSTASA